MRSNKHFASFITFTAVRAGVLNDRVASGVWPTPAAAVAACPSPALLRIGQKNRLKTFATYHASPTRQRSTPCLERCRADQQLEASVRRPSAASRHRRPRTDGAISCLESMATFSSRPRPSPPPGRTGDHRSSLLTPNSWQQHFLEEKPRFISLSRRRSLRRRCESKRHRTWWNRPESVKEIWENVRRCPGSSIRTDVAQCHVGCFCPQTEALLLLRESGG